MMRIVVVVIAFILLNSTVAQIYRYDDVVFYPDGTQNINTSKLFIDGKKLSESLVGEVLEVRIIYKNRSFMITKFNRNTTFDIPVENINLSVYISATKINTDVWIVTYTVVNNYDRGIPINITFPSGYNIKNRSVTVPGNSSITVYLHKRSKANTLYFGDSYISYRIPSKVDIIYTPSIPISIEKSNRVLNNSSIEWIANYSIYNKINVSLKANVYLWANINNTTVMSENISNVTIPPNSIYAVNRTIYSNMVPVFYSREYIWNRTEFEIVMIPVLRENDTYIVGLSKVKGKKFYCYLAPRSDESDDDDGDDSRSTDDDEDEPTTYTKDWPTDDSWNDDNDRSARDVKSRKESVKNRSVKNSDKPIKIIKNKPTEDTDEENFYKIVRMKMKKMGNLKGVITLSLFVFILNLVIIISLLSLSSSQP